MDWLIYLAVLIVIGLFVALLVIWFVLFRNKGKKRRKRRSHHHHHLPNLAEAGGLPPRRTEKTEDAPPSP